MADDSLSVVMLPSDRCYTPVCVHILPSDLLWPVSGRLQCLLLLQSPMLSPYMRHIGAGLHDIMAEL